MPYVITEPCVNVKDRGCVNVCPCDCIYDAGDQLVIEPEACIDCGACVDACPVDAVFHADDVPEKWRRYIAKNVDWFKTGEKRTPAAPKKNGS